MVTLPLIYSVCCKNTEIFVCLCTPESSAPRTVPDIQCQ